MAVLIAGSRKRNLWWHFMEQIGQCVWRYQEGYQI